MLAVSGAARVGENGGVVSDRSFHNCTPRRL